MTNQVKKIFSILFFIKNIVRENIFWYKTKQKKTFLLDFWFWSVYLDFLTMISLFGLSFLLSKGLLKPELPSQGSINVVKVLPFSFEQCFGPFTILLVKGSSKTGLFSHLFNHVLRSPSVQKDTNYQRQFFFKCSKLNLNLENAKKKSTLFFVSEINASENVAISCLW